MVLTFSFTYILWWLLKGVLDILQLRYVMLTQIKCFFLIYNTIIYITISVNLLTLGIFSIVPVCPTTKLVLLLPLLLWFCALKCTWYQDY